MAKEGDEGSNKPGKRTVFLRTGSGSEIVNYCMQMDPKGAISIQADGPEDHARAMEALEKAIPAFLRRQGQELAELVPAPAPSRPRAIGAAAVHWLKSIEADTLKKTLIIKAAAINGFWV